MLFISFVALIFFPPLFYVAFGLSSMTIGLVLALLVLVLVLVVFFQQTSPIIRLRNVAPMAVLLIFLLATHSTYFLLIDYDNRKLVAIFLFLFLFATAAVFSNVIYKCNGLVLIRIFTLLAIIGLLIGFGSFVIDFNHLNYEKYHKSMFPFSEPRGLASIRTTVLPKVRTRTCERCSAICVSAKPSLTPSTKKPSSAMSTTIWQFLNGVPSVIYHPSTRAAKSMAGQ